MKVAITGIITAIPMLMTTNRPADFTPLAEPAAELSADEAAALYRLMTWLSPAFPVGAFSYSSGIEWAVEAGDIVDVTTLQDWLAAMLADGPGFCDGVFLAHAHRAAASSDDATCARSPNLPRRSRPRASAIWKPGARPRLYRDRARGVELRRPRSADRGLRWYNRLSRCGRIVSAAHAIPLAPTMHAFLHALTSNWISAGSRLIPLGQTDSQRALAALEPVVVAVGKRALGASLDDLGSATFRADLASMRHETQYTRLFRS